jgi:ABC-type proline/glycine betaine transport system permease subunit
LSNRIAIIGSFVAGFGFFFLPLLEVKPNRLASGITVNLFEIPGDFRYMALFLLALVPLILAFQPARARRGWSLVLVGNLILFLTLILPANAALQLLDGAETLFEEGTRISNPRIFTSSAIAVGLLGGYIVLFGGLRDLVAEKIGGTARFFASTIGILLVMLFLTNGNLDIYSIMVEFGQRGDTLGQRFIEHFVFVVVSLLAGLVIGIALGLWAARDERMENLILYVVGIIQTIPSLALFGVLLVPLARLGDQDLSGVLSFTVVFLIIGVAVFVAVWRLQKFVPAQIRTVAIVAAVFVLVIPLGLAAILLITFTFRAVLNVFVEPAYNQALMLVLLGFASVPFLMFIDRRMDEIYSATYLRYGRWALLAISTLGAIVLVISGARDVIGTREVAELTVRNIGVSGIGTAPAIIALTLYSLLPLVRNTYAGLKNVDEAIIDSGRGMGMTPSQIFFQIELPLAFPIIMAGVRNAGISLVGIAAVASIIGAGALGDFILLGVNTTSVDLILLGAIPAIILAVLLDALMQLIEALFTSPGIRRQAQ